MENRDCSLPAPFFYRTIMQLSHLISYPVYILTLFILHKERSKAFQTYKYFLIVHILINMVSESFVSFFMLPMTYLPHLVLRTTGLLAHFGFSGIFQWYVLATTVMLTGGSICEMFYYRFKVGIFDYKEHKMSKFLAFCVWTFRFFAVIHAVFAFCTCGISREMIAEWTWKLWKANPEVPVELTCDQTVAAVLDDWINAVDMVIYLSMTVLAVSMALATILYMLAYLSRGLNLSKATIRMQRMFVFSLFIQGGVHAYMIAAPILLLLYARFKSFSYDNVALLMLVCIAYHGFFSTCAMILFTKPLRDKVFRMTKSSTKPVLSVQPTISAHMNSF